MSKNRLFAQSLKNLMDFWDIARAKGPHNPEGTEERAAELVRAYLAGQTLRVPKVRKS